MLSKFTWLYLLKSKYEVTAVFLQFKLFAEKQTGFPIKALQSDNAKKFISLTKMLRQFGIAHRLTCPHTH